MVCRNENSVDMGDGITVSKKDYDTRHEAKEPGYEIEFWKLIPCHEVSDPDPNSNPGFFDMSDPSPFDR